MTIPKRLYTGQPSVDVENPTTKPTINVVADAYSTLSAGNYFVRYTWNNENGETKSSNEGSVSVTASGYRLDITVPPFPAGVDYANIYVALDGYPFSHEGAIFSSGATFSLSSNPATNGSGVPTVNSIPILYTVPSTKTAIVKNIVLHNTASVDSAVTLNLVPPSSVSSTTNQILSYTVGAKDTVVIDLSGVIEAGETIEGIQQTAGLITVYISGVEV